MDKQFYAYARCQNQIGSKNYNQSNWNAKKSRAYLFVVTYYIRDS